MKNLILLFDELFLLEVWELSNPTLTIKVLDSSVLIGYPVLLDLLPLHGLYGAWEIKE